MTGNDRLPTLTTQSGGGFVVDVGVIAVAALLEISRLLNTGLDAETLAICVRLCESGVNPEALAMVIREMRRETATMTVSAADRDLTIPV